VATLRGAHGQSQCRPVFNGCDCWPSNSFVQVREEPDNPRSPTTCWALGAASSFLDPYTPRPPRQSSGRRMSTSPQLRQRRLWATSMPHASKIWYSNATKAGATYAEERGILIVSPLFAHRDFSPIFQLSGAQDRAGTARKPLTVHSAGRYQVRGWFR
jgi:hypothetical protein